MTILVACNPGGKQPEDLDAGKIENGVYRNNYLQCALPIPKNWVVQPGERFQQLHMPQTDSQTLRSDSVDANFHSSLQQTVVLVAACKVPPDSTGDGFDPSFMLVAENLGDAGVRRAGDYLAHVQQMMQQANSNYRFAEGLRPQKIGNKDFDVMEGSLDSVRQRFASTIIRNFAVTFVISYTDAAQQSELSGIMDQMRFH